MASTNSQSPSTAENGLISTADSDHALARLRTLAQKVCADAEFQRVVLQVLKRKSAGFDGIWGSSKALLAAAVLEWLREKQTADADAVPGACLFIAPSERDADRLADELGLFSAQQVVRFPRLEGDLDDRPVKDEEGAARLRVLKIIRQFKELAGKSNGHKQNQPLVIVAAIEALQQPVPSEAELASQGREVRVGGEIHPESFVRWLVERGFHRTTAIELPGEVALRGGIVDVFPLDAENPIRIELFGDEVESLREFDAMSQRSVGNIQSLELNVFQKRSKDESLLLDHLPAETFSLIFELEQTIAQATHYVELSEEAERLATSSQLLQRLAVGPLATAHSLAPGAAEDGVYKLAVESVQRFSGEIGQVKKELETAGQGSEVTVVCETPAEVERLSELLGDSSVAAAGQLHFTVGRLSEGFRFFPQGEQGKPSSTNHLIISGAEMFDRQQQVKRKAKKHLGKAIDRFVDLREGELVVHLAHGIGRYRGLELIEKNDQREEHLAIEFADNARIYVPAARIDLIQRYVGGGNRRPKLAKVGGKSWVKNRKAAERAVDDLAAEMLELQATRNVRRGIKFGPDTEWQREFDASFPYVETDDQLAAIESIKGDMESDKPMDRLLCGDVGFGKTEVAMRAAFKAVDNGFQVAVLAPTTILAEQHWNTFGDRMKEFPFDIGKLTRFNSREDEKETLAGIKRGQIDIAIGTHRLASKNVKFANLGLVIIDEEQRFGVEVKERLKALRSSVDILTLSATPIPRTLHMSLVGVRDISNLETAPEERQPVETKVTRTSHETIRHAVLRELARGGQIYFVHNRVQDIGAVKQKLEYIVPEATIRIGHGQMPEEELEQVMVDFIGGRFDLLLATTIVESGLDIPNANTIFVDESDKYGLADLHQLRGRVGRYKHRAYCYMLIDPNKPLSTNSARRLRAIEEYSEMGAGFHIAMRDLEIRGAGNLLGTEQSGHIAAVGYELYCQLLENAVRQKKKLPPKITLDVDLDLPGSAFFPDEYVPDMRQKIDLYRRLTRISHIKDIDDFYQEIVDRFGNPPPPAMRLLALAELRIDCAIWQITAVHVEDKYLVFTYASRERMQTLAQGQKGRLRIVDGSTAYVTLTQKALDEPDSIIYAAKTILQPTSVRG